MEMTSPKAYKAPAHGVPRLLIVDDEVEHAEICAALLRRRGYQVAVAITGLDAMELAQSLKPDLILLDLHMPVVDGFSTAANLHRHPDTHHVPIVFLSACGEDIGGAAEAARCPRVPVQAVPRGAAHRLRRAVAGPSGALLRWRDCSSATRAA